MTKYVFMALVCLSLNACAESNIPKLKCEYFRITPYHNLYRCSVPGGWILNSDLRDDLAFYPDEKHEWSLNNG